MIMALPFVAMGKGDCTFSFHQNLVPGTVKNGTCTERKINGETVYKSTTYQIAEDDKCQGINQNLHCNKGTETLERFVRTYKTKDCSGPYTSELLDKVTRDKHTSSDCPGKQDQNSQS